MLNRKRRLIELKDIDIPEESLKIIREFKALHHSSWRSIDHDKLFRSLAGGACVVCMEVPSKIAKYDMGNGFVMAERYCNSCFRHIKDDLHTNGLNEKIEVKKRK